MMANRAGVGGLLSMGLGNLRKKYVGDRAFYAMVFGVAVPIMIQNGITNFVSMLDNIMVGQLGTDPMSGVAIVNQVLLVFNLCIFGGLSGAGIFTAQFVGKGDHQGIRQTVRMKVYIAAASTALFALLFWLAGGELIRLFLHEGKEGLSLDATFGYGMEYLHIMMIQMLPFAVTQIFSSTLREAGETIVPMRASMIAVGVNLVGNYILIFGKFGAPALGIAGAAIATVLSRFVECAILIVYSFRHKQRFPFFDRLFSSLNIEKSLALKMVRKGTPLLINELLWSAGMTVLNQCYSLRGLEVVSSLNISSTISNLFFCVAMAVGSTITILIGQHLGAGQLEEAVLDFKKIMLLAVVLCTGIGVIMIVVAPLLAGIYNTTDTVKDLAARFLRIVGLFMPVIAYLNTCYFTLRSGGKTVITFLFDSGYTWVCMIPLAFVLTRLTSLPILPVYFLVSCMDLLKCVIGFFMVKSKIWVVNLVADQRMEE